MLTRRHALALAALIAFASGGCGSARRAAPTTPEAREVVTQTASINALLDGRYDGTMTCGEVMRLGDFGIGTFHALDGEMVVLEGQVYQVRADGSARPVSPSTRTPFAEVTFFDTDLTATLESVEGLEQVQKRLDALMPNRKRLYALRIQGRFPYVKTRSVPAQRKPYRPLTEVVKTQPTFELRDVEGTLVGFWAPDSVKGRSVPGYHLHFLTQDRTAGGHLLGLSVGKATVRLDETPDFRLLRGPAPGEAVDRQHEVDQVE